MCSSVDIVLEKSIGGALISGWDELHHYACTSCSETVGVVHSLSALVALKRRFNSTSHIHIGDTSMLVSPTACVLAIVYLAPV